MPFCFLCATNGIKEIINLISFRSNNNNLVAGSTINNKNYEKIEFFTCRDYGLRIGVVL